MCVGCLVEQLYLALFQRGIILAVYKRPIWMHSYFPFIVAGASILIVFILGTVVRTFLFRWTPSHVLMQLYTSSAW